MPETSPCGIVYFFAGEKLQLLFALSAAGFMQYAFGKMCSSEQISVLCVAKAPLPNTAFSALTTVTWNRKTPGVCRVRNRESLPPRWRY
jgi:hypothetical protein